MLEAMVLAQLQLQPQPAAPLAPPPDIRDIVPPSPLPDYVQLALTVLLGVLVALVLGVILLRYLKHRRLAAAKPPPPLSPVERARRDLEALRAELPGISPNLLSVRTSNIIKRYFFERYEDRVLFETSEEFAGREENFDRLPRSKRAALAGFLERCDRVKYSRFPEAERYSVPLVDEAFRIVDEPRQIPAAANG